MDAANAGQIYGFQFCGNCLGEIVPNGSDIEVDPSLEIRPLDVVAVLLDLEAGGAFAGFINSIGADGFMGVCKVYLGSHVSKHGETIHLVGQLNPPVVSPIPASAIKAMHRCAAVGVLTEPGPALTEEDVAAIELLLPFVTDGDERPAINPQWRMQK
ncbi:hypothetical protein LB531_20910 [Mesorhizobium sp. CO1-1-2]|uniref:hypothetical protein n=1 Tax=Mesorhizobium sp. CO1-1-2 TaxID=2876635 RepID=UPI001CCCE8F6|nr:hypothetical protein [Mesorhizobium sp. CO1-1-2]MBZ9683122.1 hypothetical protein [Mesorhizobium sp. CO1-1-2]